MLAQAGLARDPFPAFSFDGVQLLLNFSAEVLLEILPRCFACVVVGSDASSCFGGGTMLARGLHHDPGAA